MNKSSATISLARQTAVDGLLTALLIVLGMLKLPSFIPGAEFQLSAPYAVCLVASVGMKRYLGIGICASMIQLLLGTHTIWNVVIAMVFRIVAGILVTTFKNNRFVVILAGPAGTAVARLALSMLLHVPPLPLLTAALPGMVFTAVSVMVLQPILNRVMVNCHG